MPKSKAMCMVAMDSPSSAPSLGSDIRKQPRPIGETWKSVVPKVRYSISISSLCRLWFVAFGCRWASVYDNANRPTIPGVRIW